MFYFFSNLINMQLHNKFSSFLRAQPYPRPFNSCSSSEKSNNVSILHDVTCFLSGGDPTSLYNYLCSNSHIGKKFFSQVRHHNRAKNVLENIKHMHLLANNKYKSSILSLVAGSYSRTELIEAGFQFSTTQFQNATKRFSEKNFILQDYKR